MQHDWQPRQEPIRITSHRIARPMNPLVAARKQFFFEKKNQKLLLHWLARLIRPVRTEENKSFLVLFFKKELLPSHLGCFGGASLSMRVGISRRYPENRHANRPQGSPAHAQSRAIFHGAREAVAVVKAWKAITCQKPTHSPTRPSSGDCKSFSPCSARSSRERPMPRAASC